MFWLGIDLETTGLNPEKDTLIEVGAVLWCTKTQKPVWLYNELIQDTPDPLLPEIVDITGITDEDLLRWGIKIKDALKPVWEYAQKADYLVAHNHEFEMKFLANAAKKHDLPELDVPWIDTMTDLPYPDKIKTRKLSYLSAEHGFLNPYAHRALFDVLTMMSVVSKYKPDEVLELHKSPLVQVVANVSYEDRGKARTQGFRWDATRRVWYTNIKKKFLEAKQYPFAFEVLEDIPPGT